MLVSPLQALKGRFLLIAGRCIRLNIMSRSPSELQSLSRETRGMALYYHQLSPKCIKTRRLVEQLNIPLEFRDIRKCQVHRDDLLSGMGEFKVPCLKIADDGKIAWLDDHDSILSYLMEKFGDKSNASSS